MNTPVRFVGLLLMSVVLTAGCGRDGAIDLDTLPPGAEIEIVREDGHVTTGRLVAVQPDAIVIDSDDRRLPVPHDEVRTIRQPDGASRAPATIRYHDVTIPAGTVLELSLESPVASDTSRVEDRVDAQLRSPVAIDGSDVLRAGTPVRGEVTEVQRSGRVRGVAHVGLRFHSIVVDDTRYDIRAAAVDRTAPSTKTDDARTIAMPAVGGAIVGAIIDGGKGAAIGGAIGGGAGTAVVLSTRGEEVRLGRGARLAVRLVDDVTVRVPVAGM